METLNQTKRNCSETYNQTTYSKQCFEQKSTRNILETTQNAFAQNSIYNTVIHSNPNDCRVENADFNTIRNVNTFSRSPKIEEKQINKIKRECLKTEYSHSEFNTFNKGIKSPKVIDDKSLEKLVCNGESKNANTNIKKEYDKIKTENGNDESSKLLAGENLIPNNRKKRFSGANSSPYKDKKRKKAFDDVAMDQQLLPPTNHERIDSNILPPPQQKPIFTKVYYSYFERMNDGDEIREVK